MGASSRGREGKGEVRRRLALLLRFESVGQTRGRRETAKPRRSGFISPDVERTIAAPAAAAAAALCEQNTGSAVAPSAERRRSRETSNSDPRQGERRRFACDSPLHNQRCPSFPVVAACVVPRKSRLTTPRLQITTPPVVLSTHSPTLHRARCRECYRHRHRQCHSSHRRRRRQPTFDACVILRLPLSSLSPSLLHALLLPLGRRRAPFVRTLFSPSSCCIDGDALPATFQTGNETTRQTPPRPPLISSLAEPLFTQATNPSARDVVVQGFLHTFFPLVRRPHQMSECVAVRRRRQLGGRGKRRGREKGGARGGGRPSREKVFQRRADRRACTVQTHTNTH